MITEIEIENFRCFEHTKIEGFARVNLIGGKNNSGKTALLEAILLNQSPRVETILVLRGIRDESGELQLRKPQDTWNYLFFKENIKNNIVFHFSTKQSEIIKITLSVTNESREIGKDIQKGWKYPIMTPKPDDAIKGLGEVSDFCSTLTIERKVFLNKNLELLHNLYLSANSRAIMYKNNDENVPYAQYISPRLTINRDIFNKAISSYGLAKGYEKLEHHNQEKMLNILKIIDPSLEKITLVDHKTPDSPMLYLKRKNEEPLPLAFFGDAMNRVLLIAFRLINNRSHYLLIDEIENGIHYTNHRDFWKALFELAKQLDVQIFATTHSLEMIQAFRDIGLLEDYQGDGAYFKMAINRRNGRIVGIQYDLDLLDYKLRRNEGVRGE